MKELIFQDGGAPALYVRENLLKSTDLPNSIKPFINKIEINNFDFHHEREWRVPKDFEFEHNDISILYAPIKHHEELRKRYPEIKFILDLDLLQIF